MPIYEYVCNDCQVKYERIVRDTSDGVACPRCGSARKTLQFSVFSSPREAGSSGESSSNSSGAACGCTPSSCGCH